MATTDEMLADLIDAYKILSGSRHITEADKRRLTFVVAGVMANLVPHLREQKQRLTAMEEQLNDIRRTLASMDAKTPGNNESRTSKER